MDITTFIGIVLGFVLVGGAIAMGTGAAGFLNFPAMLITMGGTLAATLIAFSLREIRSVIAVTRKAFFHRRDNIPGIIKTMLRFALKARREGILALESEMDTVRDPFIVKSLQLAIDGTSPEIMEGVLRTEVRRIEERHALGQRLHRTMGLFAPAFGMIGTLIGLVQMLGSLTTPDKIGAGMAVALITTFYGALLANLVFIPLAGKLGIRAKQEAFLRQMTLEGLLSISRGESPTAVRERMHAFLSTKNREELKPNV